MTNIVWVHWHLKFEHVWPEAAGRGLWSGGCRPCRKSADRPLGWHWVFLGGKIIAISMALTKMAYLRYGNSYELVWICSDTWQNPCKSPCWSMLNRYIMLIQRNSTFYKSDQFPAHVLFNRRQSLKYDLPRNAVKNCRKPVSCGFSLKFIHLSRI